MVSYEDILLRIRGQDSSGSAFGSAQQRVGALKATVGAAVTAMSASMLSYAKSAVDSAMTAEQEWNKFGNAVNRTGGNWDNQSAEIKSWVKDYSNSMGRSVADTRAAMTTYMNMGMSLQDSQNAMQATSNYAAQMGMSQEQAAGQLQKAFMGSGRALKALGLDIKDYKDSTTGAIDRQKLLNDVLSRTGGAAGKYADSSAAKVQRLNNVLAGLKTDFGAALMDAITPLIPVIQGFLNMINQLPGPVKTVGFAAIALGAGIGIIAGPLMSVIGLMETLGISLPTISGLLGVMGTETAALTAEEIALAAAQAGLTAEEIGAAAAHAGNTGLLAAEGAAATGASGGFWAMAAAELAALWPILLIIAAVAAFIIAVEQIGEALGWWTDFGTMIDAIKAGVERLWNAFINSPQVQGTLKAIGDAFAQLQAMVQPVIDWLTAAWNNLFQSEGEGSGGPDAVGAIINAFGTLGSIAGDVVNTLVSFGQQVWTALQPIASIIMGIVSTFGQLINGEISFEQFVMQIMALVANLHMYVGQLMVQLGQRILTGLINAVRPLPGMIWNFLTQTVVRLVMFAAMAFIRARLAGLRILTAIIAYVRQIPGRVFAWMMQVPGRILSVAGAAASAATNLATNVVNAIRDGIMGVAETVYNEFMKIPQRINDSVSNAVSAAANFGSGIKDAVLNALHIASPGIIQRKIAIEFADIPGRIGESTRAVFAAASNYAGNILHGFNAPQMDMASVGVVRQNSTYTPTEGYGKGNVTIVNVYEGAVPVDARNLSKREATAIVTLALESLGNPDEVGV